MPRSESILIGAFYILNFRLSAIGLSVVQAASTSV
uniref:Uncharacterized protein n=1 Tax=Myoviridae sp. ctu2j3 TaxID=2825197 RepID=A0A8S5UIK2_9CAUD|nr:MAG TPA: hypothetical protein [Myoviridae sp. ctu2j3]DAF94259.1 MAG TPA: hypothetical protein [Myoviridae sp. ctu2j3]